MTEILANALIREDFYSFLQRAYFDISGGQKLIPNWHLEVLCDRLEKVRKGEIKRLIINLPPRSLKSQLINVTFTAWTQVAKDLDVVNCSAFDNDCSGILNDMVAEVGLDPICPRNISDHSFHIYHYFETGYAMSTALHEITHFVWFYFWQKHFKDKPDEYDYPHLKWLLSEIVVETIIRNSKINDLIKQPQYIAYSYFYCMEIGGELIFDTMKKLYLERKDIYDFMEKSYDWIQKNETELRKKIAKAER